MRVAVVSPYSWTYPGGVNRHIEALAEQMLSTGHEVRVLAPYDPPGALTGALHRGAQPQERAAPDYLVPVGRSLGLSFNGAVSNCALTPAAVALQRRALREGRFDVVHVHEPVALLTAWDAALSTRAPLVGTFHTYSTSPMTNHASSLIGGRRMLNKLHVRIAVSEAAEWTYRRFYGGRYRIIPNGVHLPAALAPKQPADHLRIVFVGQAVTRKGLPVLLRAFEALREHVPATLTVIGVEQQELAPLLLGDQHGVSVLGKVDDATKQAALAEADVLCAPSLGGESFGMVLTEAFAAGTPVVASDIPGYRSVVSAGTDGVLVPPGDALALAEALRDLWHEPVRRAAMGEAARASADRYAWPVVADEVLKAYEDAAAVECPATAVSRAAVRIGARPADLGPRVRPQRLASLEPPDPGGRRRGALALARKAAVLLAAAGGLVLALLALERIGVDRVVASLIDSSPAWVLAGLALMCASMVLRAVAWLAILQAALPRARVRLRDAIQGTFIGVLMSATLPARLGEPSRALIVARRTGRPREHLPIVLGTVVSQTVLNLVALLVLGTVMLSSVPIFSGHQSALIAAAIAPLALLIVVLAAPALLGRSRKARARSALARARRELARVRMGLAVFRSPRHAFVATTFQLGAWTLQWLSCYALLAALGLDHRAGMGAAAAVLFAVNVTAVIPATPSNVGVFQAACVAVLHGAYGIGSADALGYGIVLQAVEIATAVVMGGPALLGEGLSWRDVRLRALHASPIELAPRSSRSADAAEA